MLKLIVACFLAAPFSARAQADPDLRRHMNNVISQMRGPIKDFSFTACLNVVAQAEKLSIDDLARFTSAFLEFNRRVDQVRNPFERKTYEKFTNSIRRVLVRAKADACTREVSRPIGDDLTSGGDNPYRAPRDTRVPSNENDY